MIFFKYLSISFLTLIHLVGYGQYEQVWAFGNNAGLNFNIIPPTAIQTSINTSEGSASICDINGDLLFYTDGNSVWNKNHNLMPNGMDLPGRNYNISNSTTQGTLIVPNPANNKQYYIFSLGCNECPYSGHLYYSMIDITLDNGLGDVLLNQKGMFIDSSLSEHLTAVMRDYCSIWVLCISRINNTMQAYLVDENGISATPITTPIIPGGGLYHGILGSIIASPDGSKIAISRGNLVLYDFNTFTGKVSNPLVLVEDPASDRYYSCFSKDNSKLYSSGKDTLFQFDLSLNSGTQIIQSILPIANYDIGFASMKRGSDEKIYLTNPYVDSLHVIHHPSILGQGCQFIRNDLALLSNTSSLIGLPNTTTMPLEPLSFQTTVTDTTICHTDSFLLHAKILNGSNFKWSDGQNGPHGMYNSSGEYWVRYIIPDSYNCSPIVVIDTYRVEVPPEIKIITDDTVVCMGSVVAIDVVAPADYNYYWSPVTGVSNTTIPNPDIKPDSTTNYTLTANYPGCPDTSFSILIAVQSIQVELGVDKEVCYGDIVALESTVEPHRYDYQYSWSPIDGLQFATTPNNYFQADSSRTYALEVFTPIGCNGVDSIHIKVLPTDFSLLNTDTILCKGDTLHIEAFGSEGYVYQWSPGNGVSDTLALEPYVIATESHTYTLTATHPKCKDFSQSFVLTIDTPYRPTFRIDPDEVCVGRPVSFYPLLDSSTTGLRWTFSEVGSQVETTLESHYQHTFDRAGRLPITMHARFRACPDTSYTDSIMVYPLPEVDLGSDGSICLHGAPVYLKNLRAAPLSPYHQVWSTGDTTEILKVVHPGIYTLSVTTEALGCTTTESIVIRKDCFIDIPNAFSPNGDGHNDFFFPRQLLSESTSRFHMQVFNRWGQLVFETRSPDGRGWDGRFNGNDQPMGVYLYQIEVDFSEDRKKEQYTGNVTLIR